ncbi:helix-turn-helix domain-containing protein [Hydrogenophaga sp.]|uniref:AraC family transcriptional regulator n=1 Tax=Hydrogenophaga sp. TaxID=1904254 RepID=UPI003568A09C
MTVKSDWGTYDAVAGRDAASPAEVLKNAHSAWAGLPMMKVPLPGSAEVINHAVIHPSLAIALSGRGKRTYRSGIHVRELYSAERMFELYGEGYCIDHGRWEGVPGEVLGVQFPTQLVNGLLHAHSGGFRLPTAHELFDDRLVGLALSLWSEAEAGGPLGTLYAQGLTLALLGFLGEQHGAWSHQGNVRSTAKMSMADRTLVRDYIEQHMASDLSVVTLAELVRVSPAHFARAFKATFDISPHAYVTERRIESARWMLHSERGRSLAEIAGSVGFSSQSHFTEAFRRRMGVTPGRWRANG